MSFCDSFPRKTTYDSYAAAVPQGARTVPNSPSLGHHLPPRAYPSYTMSGSGAYDPAASTSAGGELLPPLGPADHLVHSPLVGHHSQPTSPILTSSGAGGGPYFTTFEPAPGAGPSAPHSRQTSVDTPRQGHHTVTTLPARGPTPEQRSTGPAGAAFGSSLKVVQWTPQHGEEGTQVTIILDAAAVHAAHPSAVTGQAASFGTGSPALGGSPRKAAGINRRFSVLFGLAPAPTRFERARAIDGNGVGQSMTAGPNEEDAFVVLSAFVPARSAMGAPGERAMVYVQSIDTDSNAVVEQCIVGEWDPQSSIPVASTSAALPGTPTRVGALKRSGDDLVSGREAPALRSPHLGGGTGSVHGSPARSQGEWGVHTHSHSHPHSQQHSAVHSQHAHSQHASPALPYAAVFSGAVGVDDQQQQAPGAYPQQPELIRTSQIHAPKNGYGATYSHKVVLKLQGDLNTMAMGWSNEEWTNRRRLIQFWPQQDGNVINVGFRPIAQSEYVQNAIVISCIFRDEWNECFVTSVDTIYLLEALVGARFTVEEKNRIRRNLEGFKPQTVSKSKPDAEPFFKLIMGFPNPKPRNIEKDVKVFPWKVLALALKKIMSKYSANYPLGADGAPVAIPPVVTEPGDDDDGTDGSPSGTPHLVHSQLHVPVPGAHAVSPRLAQAHAHVHGVGSPHVPHASPHLAHAASPHLAHTSPRLGAAQQQHAYTHSPQQQSTSAYAPFASGSGSGGSGSSAPAEGGGYYAAADDYAVSRSHYGAAGQMGRSGGTGGSGSQLRSYSDGVDQYTQPGASTGAAGGAGHSWAPGRSPGEDGLGDEREREEP